MTQTDGKIAVVLFNLGGPDRLAAVRPFLHNLFSDPAIIPGSSVRRWFLARLISWLRAPVSRKIYARIGGGSPILANTEAQGRALAFWLGAERPQSTFRCFPAMRYWHPMVPEARREVAAWQPDRVVLLPLYPQYSTTTTESSFTAWDAAAADAGAADVACPVHRICCYPDMPGFLEALIDGAAGALSVAGPDARLLFSAHGLPQKIVDAGDPYVLQVERTAEMVLGVLEQNLRRRNIDSVVCYQSRVGPVKWTHPYTADEIRRAGREGRALAIVPIAFVSENSETLDELDNEYRELAAKSGVPVYARAPTVSTDNFFIAGLGRMVLRALAEETSPPKISLMPGSALWRCPKHSTGCPLRATADVGTGEMDAGKIDAGRIAS